METLPNIPESCDVIKLLETWKQPIGRYLVRLLVKGDVLRRKRAKEDSGYKEREAATDILEQALVRKEFTSLMVSLSTTTTIEPTSDCHIMLMTSYTNSYIHTTCNRNMIAVSWIEEL